MVQDIYQFISNNRQKFLPLFSSNVEAGFPSPADGYIEKKLDLNSYLIKHTEATFFIKAVGYNVNYLGIYDHDLLIVDRSIKPTHGKIVIAAMAGEFFVKKYIKNKGKFFLAAESKEKREIELKNNPDIQIWGTVTGVVRNLT